MARFGLQSLPNSFGRSFWPLPFATMATKWTMHLSSWTMPFANWTGICSRRRCNNCYSQSSLSFKIMLTSKRMEIYFAHGTHIKRWFSGENVTRSAIGQITQKDFSECKNSRREILRNVEKVENKKSPKYKNMENQKIQNFEKKIFWRIEISTEQCFAYEISSGEFHWAHFYLPKKKSEFLHCKV